MNTIAVNDLKNDKEDFAVILFHSNNYVMWVAKLLRKSDFYYKIVGIPRELSSDCGYCIQIKLAETEEISGLLNSVEIEYDRIEPLRKE